jgi:hypothetical protein
MNFGKKLNIFCFLLICIVHKATAQNSINWTNDELIEPSALSSAIKSNKNVPVIFSVGPGAVIPQSKNIGMVRKTENLQKFKDQLATLPKDTQIVVYCGCCPFDHCPNVRPAIQLLKDMKFTNFKLLDLPHNIKTDWIDHGYPTQN